MGSPDRLSPLDASFLHIEDATSHMHVAGVLVFGGEAPPYEDFLAHIEERLDHVPRYRQRLAWVPFGQGGRNGSTTSIWISATTCARPPCRRRRPSTSCRCSPGACSPCA